MKDIAIFGAGGLGRETMLMINQINEKTPEWNIIGFFDDDIKGFVEKLPVLGGIDELNSWDKEINIAIAIANPSIRRKIAEYIDNPLVKFPNLFHPSCNLGSKQNTFGKGCIVTAGCIATLNVHLRDFVIVNLLTSIGHDVTIGSYTSIMPNCSLSGFADIGEECFIGAGARILQNLKIGNGVTIGAGAVVTKSVEENTTVVGVPAKKM